MTKAEREKLEALVRLWRLKARKWRLWGDEIAEGVAQGLEVAAGTLEELLEAFPEPPEPEPKRGEIRCIHAERLRKKGLL